jgi:IS5 family transposase
MDSTLFLANASMDALEPFAGPPLEPLQFIQQVFAENQVAEDSEPVSVSGASRYRREARKAKTKQAPANKRERSRTDPEASIMRHPGIGTHLAYKAHVAVDDHPARVITAAVVTPGAIADEHLLNELLWRHRRIVGRLPGDVVADRKDGTMENYSYLAQLGLHAVIPDRLGHKRHPGGVWSIADFNYDAEKDAYECAAGQWLPHVYTRPSDRTSSYIAPPGVCESCQFRAECSPSGKPRTLRRHMDRVYLEAAAQWLRSGEGRSRFKQRKVYIETTFAWAKDLHGLRRAQWRGRWKVQVQLWLTAAAMNFKEASKGNRRRTGHTPTVPGQPGRHDFAPNI